MRILILVFLPMLAAVAAYLAAIEGEIQAVRMILTGRLAGVKPEAIRERLRDLYA